MLPDTLFFLCISQSSITENRNPSSYFKYNGQRASNRELGTYNRLNGRLQDWAQKNNEEPAPQEVINSQEDGKSGHFPWIVSSRNSQESRKVLILLLLAPEPIPHLLGPHGQQKEQQLKRCCWLPKAGDRNSATGKPKVSFMPATRAVGPLSLKSHLNASDQSKS